MFYHGIFVAETVFDLRSQHGEDIALQAGKRVFGQSVCLEQPYEMTRRSQVLHTTIGINNISGPLLSGGIEKTRRVDLSPDSALSIKRCRCGGCFGNVHLYRPLVSSRYGIFAGALVMLVPLEAWDKIFITKKDIS